MLAGYGEVDVVAALARHDPDAMVRSTAARYVGELCELHPDAFAIADQMFDEPHEAIRAAVIAGLPQLVPANLQARLRAAESDPSPMVRQALSRRARTSCACSSRRWSAPYSVSR